MAMPYHGDVRADAERRAHEESAREATARAKSTEPVDRVWAEFETVLTLKVEVSPKSGCYFVTSPEDPGLVVSGTTFEEALAEVPSALRSLDKARTTLNLEHTRRKI
jgi:predicted RNase H-like HicB family nuclease